MEDKTKESIGLGGFFKKLFFSKRRKQPEIVIELEMGADEDEGENEELSNYSSEESEGNSPMKENVYVERKPTKRPIFDYFWSDNLDRDSQWYEDLYGICFPCCVGNPFSKIRLKDYLRLFLTFTFWVSIADIVYIIVEFFYGVHPLSMFYSPNPTRLSKILIRLGGKYSFGIKEYYEIYRFFTAIFIHIDVVHLVINLCIQLALMLGYERNWKIWRIIIVYIFSGIGGNIISSIAYPDVVTVGASGSLMGIILAKAAEICCRFREFRKVELVVHIVSIVFIILITGIMSFSPSVDWAGHLGGSILGLFFGFALFANYIKNKWVKIFVFIFSMMSILMIFLGAIFMFVFVAKPTDLFDYAHQI